jgi:hypothetical protein
MKFAGIVMLGVAAVPFGDAAALAMNGLASILPQQVPGCIMVAVQLISTRSTVPHQC